MKTFNIRKYNATTRSDELENTTYYKAITIDKYTVCIHKSTGSRYWYATEASTGYMLNKYTPTTAKQAVLDAIEILGDKRDQLDDIIENLINLKGVANDISSLKITEHYELPAKQAVVVKGRNADTDDLPF